MKLKKVTKILKKINSLVDQWQDEEEISQLELDLLKEYTRDFYEKLNQLAESKYVAITSDENADKRSTAGTLEAESIPEEQAINPKYKYKIGQISDDSLKKEAKNLAEKVAKEQADDNEEEASAQAPIGQVDIPTSDIPVDIMEEKEVPAAETTSPPPEQSEESDELDIPALELEIEDDEVEASAPPAPEVKAEKAEESVKEATPATEPEAIAQPKQQVPDKFKELFALEESYDLSDKLSNAPIKDIRSSMGLNERVLTINELFGGNAMTFDKTVKALNQMDNFEDAKAFLSKEIVPQHEWNEEGKLKKAKIFLKLVRRRYHS